MGFSLGLFTPQLDYREKKQDNDNPYIYSILGYMRSNDYITYKVIDITNRDR